MIRLRVKEVAEQKQISMGKLSRTADVAYNTIKAIYRDPYKEVTTTTLNKISAALGVPASELIEDVPEKMTATATARNATVTATTTTALAAYATATATDNPYPFCGALLMDDSLMDNSRGYVWYVGSDNAGGDCEFTGGSFHVRESGAGSSYAYMANRDYSDFAIQVQMTIIKGDIGGIEFRANHTNKTWYTFCVGEDGTYWLDRDQQDINVVPQTSSSFINKGRGQINLIAVVAQESTITLYVNGQQIDSVTDSANSHGEIGLLAGEYKTCGSPADVAYNNLKVWRLWQGYCLGKY